MLAPAKPPSLHRAKITELATVCMQGAMELPPLSGSYTDSPDDVGGTLRRLLLAYAVLYVVMSPGYPLMTLTGLPGLYCTGRQLARAAFPTKVGLLHACACCRHQPEPRLDTCARSAYIWVHGTDA